MTRALYVRAMVVHMECAFEESGAMSIEHAGSSNILRLTDTYGIALCESYKENPNSVAIKSSVGQAVVIDGARMGVNHVNNSEDEARLMFLSSSDVISVGEL